jgi:cysteine desulfuration protein SufE
MFDSDSLLIKGLIWIFATIFDKHPALDVSVFDANVLEQIGLGQHLTATRANGLKKVLEYIKKQAIEIHEKNNQR